MTRALVLAVAVAALRVSSASAAPPEPIEITDPLPYGLRAIDYSGLASDDAAARLNRRLESGEARLERSDDSGWLRSLIEALGVPVESQLLVFSKTALNPNRVGPKSPRAVYFSDDVSVGWVPGAEAIEVLALDRVKGPVFYTLAQQADAPPKLRREERCIACHAGTTTLQVPGLIVRSFVTDAAGNPSAGWSRVTHDMPLEKRCGGWFVSGTHGTMTHSGNVFGEVALDAFRRDPAARGNVTDLSPLVDLSRYPSRHSDLVAHLVLQHQAHGINLLTRVGYEARLGKRSDAEEQLVRYFLFADEPPLLSPVKGTTEFAVRFENRGPRDGRGRSLRQLNLKTRLFEHRLSYLIHSPLFDGLPGDVKDRLYQRLFAVLTGETRLESAAEPGEAERRDILEILRETIADLPAALQTDRESKPRSTSD